MQLIEISRMIQRLRENPPKQWQGRERTAYLTALMDVESELIAINTERMLKEMTNNETIG